ncbi:hypothetical protein [Actinophytocola sp.]|uniref:hypothetical protein n=1 Tax=Actinophytocola sp. TaxID=1872138 RepID=UPI002ED0E536
MTVFLRSIASGIVALGAIGLFVIIGGIAILETLSNSAPANSGGVSTDLWNGLIVFVGGVVAAGFGLRLPAPNDPPGGRNPLSGLGVLAFTDHAPLRMRTAIGGVYALVYLLFGIFAVAIWWFKGNATPEMVRELAMAFLGIAFPIVTMYFKS